MTEDNCLGDSAAESVKIYNCTNEEGNGIMCALLAWREGILKEKSILSELGK